ncbi:hypothetical protein AB205_0195210 [Aquarana catesbeiana]|uniref:Uncharacterized protein n=1 Tax=Aquarana catesbeiana TaxID=8400 RepID=A0A2G9Q6A6_AQUCT|nr:hypothetical protein AB205_0195210 [Aquarana catesbeiana]
MFTIYSSAIKSLCAKYSIFVLHRGEKTRRTPPHPRRTQTPHLWKKGKSPPTQEVKEEEEDVVEIVTTTGDRDVVDPDPFTSESAQILIGEIMG